MTDIQRIGIIGLGLMGSGIAEVCARAGFEVIALETNPAALEAGLARVDTSLNSAVRRNKIDQTARDAARALIRGTTSMSDLDDRDLVIEAATEDETQKLAIFARLDNIVTSPDAILASNTSSIPIAKIASATNRRANVIGMHFFNPAPVLQLVEVIPSLLTSEETITAIERFAADKLGKTPIRAADHAGFIVNALLVPYLMSAIRLLEAGHATAEDIDTGMTLGCAHPMGPLALVDLVGLDTAMYAARSMHDEYHDAHYAPPALLNRMVESGLLGRKSGQGFYSYF